MTDRIPETDLILPALYLVSVNGAMTTSELIPKLRIIMKPTGEDLKILSGRSDDKFSQKVRNLKAHNTFERFGYAEYKGGYVYITDEGKQHLEKNRDILRYLLINDFSYSDLTENLQKIEAKKDKRKIEVFDENVIISEGLKKATGGNTYERSTLLRSYAISYFKKNGGIDCKCCTFNFREFYGKDIGNGFIEIHHVKPVFKYDDQDLIKTIEKAVKNLMPVCSNCHRMIHKNWSKPLEIQILIDAINANGVFKRFAP